MNIFLGPNFVSLGWMEVSLEYSVPKGKFHCTLLATSKSETGNNRTKHNSILTSLLTASQYTET